MVYIKNYRDLSQLDAWSRFYEEEPIGNSKYYVMMHQVMDRGSSIGEYYIDYFINVSIK